MSAHAYTGRQKFLGNGIYTMSYVPEKTPGAFLTVCMPFGDERRNVARAVHDLLQECAGRGIAGITFDYPGMGESTGDTASCSLSTAHTAAEQVYDYAFEEFSPAAGVVLGLRSGSFTAASLVRSKGAPLVLLQPFISGSLFLRELKLKEKIRGALTEKESAGYLLNGERISDRFKEELANTDEIIGGGGGAAVFVIQISPSSSPAAAYRNLPEGTGFSSVRGFPFWNPHEGENYSDMIKETAGIVQSFAEGGE